MPIFLSIALFKTKFYYWNQKVLCGELSATRQRKDAQRQTD